MKICLRNFEVLLSFACKTKRFLYLFGGAQRRLTKAPQARRPGDITRPGTPPGKPLVLIIFASSPHSHDLRIHKVREVSSWYYPESVFRNVDKIEEVPGCHGNSARPETRLSRRG